jgi:hypothetical protein
MPSLTQKHLAQSKSLVSGHVRRKYCIKGILYILLGCVELSLMIFNAT